MRPRRGDWRHLPWSPRHQGAGSIHSALNKASRLTSGGRLVGTTMAMFRAES